MKTNSDPQLEDLLDPDPSEWLEAQLERDDEPWILMTGSGSITGLLLAIIAGQSCQGLVRVLDAGARQHKSMLLDLDLSFWGAEDLRRVNQLRAYNCAHLLAVLEQIPTDGVPTVVLDLLDTFHDKRFPLAVRQWLLSRCLKHLDRIGKYGNLLVELEPLYDQDDDENEQLFIQAENGAARVTHVEWCAHAQPADPKPADSGSAEACEPTDAGDS